jgi:hypothetical protein
VFQGLAAAVAVLLIALAAVLALLFRQRRQFRRTTTAIMRQNGNRPLLFRPTSPVDQYSTIDGGKSAPDGVEGPYSDPYDRHSTEKSLDAQR